MTIEKVLRGIVLVCLFVVPFVPLIVAGVVGGSFFSLYFPFISGKNFVFRMLVEVALAALVLLALINPAYRPKRTALTLSIILLLFVTFLSDVFGVYLYKSFWSNFERMEGFIGLAHIASYFFVLAHAFRGRLVWSRFFHVILGVSLFVVLYSILQIAGELVINQGGLRVDATFGNAIYLAVYMLFAFFLSLFLSVQTRVSGRGRDVFYSLVIGFGLFIVYYLVRIIPEGVGAKAPGITLSALSLLLLAAAVFALWRSRGERLVSVYIQKTIYLVLAAAFLVVIVYTATRGVIVGLAAAALAASVLALAFGRESRKMKIAGGVCLALIVASIAAFFVLRAVPVVRNHKILGRVASISLKDEDAKARLRVWNMAWKGFKERPILGWGQENFNYVFNKYYDPKMFNREQWFDRTHNVLLDWLSTTGIVGLLAYLSLFAAAVFLLWRKTGNQSTLGERIIITSMFTGYFVQNLLVFDNLTSYIFFFTWLALIQRKSLGFSVSAPQVSGAKPQNSSALRFYGPAVVIILVVFIYYLNIRPIQAGSALISAIRPHETGITENFELFRRALRYMTFASTEIREQLVQIAGQVAESDLSADIKKNFFELTKSELDRQLEKTPDDARYYLFMGVHMNKTSNYAEALHYLAKAHELSPGKQMILIEIGSSYLNSGRFVEAVAAFRQALDLAPEFKEVRIIYAVGNIYAGDFSEAAKYIEEDWGLDQRILRAYMNTKQYSRAIAFAQNAIKKYPSDALNYQFLAGALLQAGRVNEAVAALQKSTELDPSLKAVNDAYIQAIKQGKR